MSQKTDLQANNIDLQAILDTINGLPEAESGLDTSDATASESDILSGKTAYVDGEKITGNIATKTSSNLTANGATVTVPSGYYASQVTKSVATATQATPSVSINANGLITASATQAAGYVSAGTKSGTKQLTTQSSKTITPTKSSQTAVAKNVYTTGAVTVGAIPSNYITTTDATAAANEILSGETAYVNGSKVTGTMKNNGAISTTMDGINTKSVTVPAGYTSGGIVSLTDDIDNEVDTQADLISQITTALNGKAAGGIPSNYEDVGTETSAYTTKLASLESAITALETELEGKASGGGGGSAGEWIPVSSLPTTYLAEPGSSFSTFYYEVPENCVAVVLWMMDSGRCAVSGRSNTNDFLSETTSHGFGKLSDADNTGTILKIEVDSLSVTYTKILPLYA